MPVDTTPLFRVTMAEDAAVRLAPVLVSGWIGQGPKVDEFEAALQPWTGGGEVVTVNSGTAALVLALRLIEARGKYVITTPMTCSATNIAILNAGAAPLWADVDPVTGLIDPLSVRHRLADYGDRVAAVIAVDWAGQPADYDALASETRGLGIPVISDAAHSFGATYNGRRVGEVADLTCFSFQAIKTLTTGDGGALTFGRDHQHLAKRARDLRWFGIDRTTDVLFRGEQDITEWGYKFHMNDIAATIGLANLPYVRGTLALQRHHAATYDIHLDAKFGRTVPAADANGAWWFYIVRLTDPAEREAFREHMLGQGIVTSQSHWRNDRLTIFAEQQRNDLPGMDEFGERMICLPTHAGANEWHVVSAANRFFG
jgi:dTDP-4-amino-4,6-dideoxygalactose transaminase